MDAVRLAEEGIIASAKSFEEARSARRSERQQVEDLSRELEGTVAPRVMALLSNLASQHHRLLLHGGGGGGGGGGAELSPMLEAADKAEEAVEEARAMLRLVGALVTTDPTFYSSRSMSLQFSLLGI